MVSSTIVIGYELNNINNLIWIIIEVKNMPKTNANGIEIEYDTFGEKSSEPLLLIMGWGTQMIAWDEKFCNMLVEKGIIEGKKKKASKISKKRLAKKEKAEKKAGEEKALEAEKKESEDAPKEEVKDKAKPEEKKEDKPEEPKKEDKPAEEPKQEESEKAGDEGGAKPLANEGKPSGEVKAIPTKELEEKAEENTQLNKPEDQA